MLYFGSEACLEGSISESAATKHCNTIFLLEYFKPSAISGAGMAMEASASPPSPSNHPCNTMDNSCSS